MARAAVGEVYDLSVAVKSLLFTVPFCEVFIRLMSLGFACLGKVTWDPR